MLDQRPKIGAGVVIIKDDLTLLAQRYGKHGSGMWGSTGGHVEFGETPTETVKREAREELGIEIGNLRFAACINMIRDGKHYLDVSFVAEIISGEPTIMEPDSIAQIGWYPLNDLPTPLFPPVAAVLEALQTGKAYFETTENQEISTTQDGARFCEIWFNVGRANDYTEMLDWFAEHNVHVGLHHWGLANNRYKTNLATNEKWLRDETIAQIKHTIDIGQSYACGYVNVHPGAAAVEENNFETETQQPASFPVTAAPDARANILAAARQLSDYAREKNVLLTFETLPGMEQFQSDDRQNIYDPENVPLTVMRELTRHHVAIANDVTHTAGQLARQHSDPNILWKGLRTFTRAVQPATRLLHINTVTPPFNGTDSHGGILADDFTEHAFPSRDQLIELLSLFSGRDDIYIIPEPKDQMQANFQALVKLVAESQLES